MATPAVVVGGVCVIITAGSPRERRELPFAPPHARGSQGRNPHRTGEVERVDLVVPSDFGSARGVSGGEPTNGRSESPPQSQ